jgi:signal transduction histidine kinase
MSQSTPSHHQVWSLRRVVLVVQATGFFIILFAISTAVYSFIFGSERALWQSRQSDFALTAARVVSDTLDQSRLFMDIINDLDNTAPNFTQVVSNIASRYETVQEVIVLDGNANILTNFSTDAPILSNLFTIRQSNWFLTTRGGENYLGNLQFSSQNIPYIILARPYEKVRGSIAVRLNMEILNQVVEDIRFGETGNAYLVNTEGQILAHSDFSIVERNTNIASRPEFQQAINQEGLYFNPDYFNFLDREVIGTSLKIEGTNWFIFSEVEQDEAYATSAIANLLLLGGFTALFLLAIFGAGLFLQRFVFDRIAQLQNAAKQVTEGNLSVQVPVVRMDEIGELATTFNTMTATLNKNTEDLRHARDEALVAKEIAQENSRLKSEFLSTMSHELRTPLNAIEGFTGIMLSGMGIQLNAKAYSMVERISTNSKRLVELVNAFLDISRIESGRMDLVEVPFSPAELAEKWRKQISVLADQKGILFTINIDPELPEKLLGDDDALSKIGQNLLSNAIKFTESGRVILEMKRNNDEWLIIVTDTGIGIPPHARSYIFDEFRQVDGSSTRKYGGTGLGLAIVQKLVRLMNGTIRVDSELGVGSTFTVTLPLKIAETQPTTEAVSS